jgi:hypothetical protein
MSIQEDFGGFDRAVSDVFYTTQGGLFQPDYFGLQTSLLRLAQQSHNMLPSIYVSNVLRPFTAYIENLGKEDFDILFSKDSAQLDSASRSLRKAIEEVAEALLQRDPNSYYKSAFYDLVAFQAVVSTIYDDVLTNPLSRFPKDSIPPLAKWGSAKGPYTLPASLLEKVKVKAGVVTLPAEHRNGGLLAWVSLGHEVGGHNILRILPELIPQLQKAVKQAIEDMDTISDLSMRQKLANYWFECTEETACDQLGLLHIGPSFGIAILGHLQALRKGKLQSSGPLHPHKKFLRSVHLKSKSIDHFIYNININIDLKGDTGFFGHDLQGDPITYETVSFHSGKHPIDILRPFSLATGISIINPESPWSAWLEEKAEKDLSSKHVSFQEMDTSSPPQRIVYDVPFELVAMTARVAAKTILTTPLECLGDGNNLQSLITWDDTDEVIVSEIRTALRDEEVQELPSLPIKDKSYARHVIGAAVLEAIRSESDIEKTFKKMKQFLVNSLEKTTSHGESSNIVICDPIERPESPTNTPELPSIQATKETLSSLSTLVLNSTPPTRALKMHSPSPVECLLGVFKSAICFIILFACICPPPQALRN